MSSTKPITRERNLLLCFDAFGTLFKPSKPIPLSYAQAAIRHGIHIPDADNPTSVSSSFKSAFKRASSEHPNYGKATGMGAEKWWGTVIENTFTPFLGPNQSVPPGLTKELLHMYSSSEGYTLYPDVLPFFNMLRPQKYQYSHSTTNRGLWPWKKTVVGVITNSDDRVPGILSSFALKVNPRRHGIDSRKKQDDAEKRPVKRKATRSKMTRKARIHLRDDVDFTVLSYDVGAEKPDRRIFAAAEKMLDRTLKSDWEASYHTPMASFEKLYVGDDLTKDVFGAQDAGWSSVLLEREPVGGLNYGLKVAEEDERGEDGEAKIAKRMVARTRDLLNLCSWSPDLEPQEAPIVRYDRGERK
jgi:FMN phosphatase YigB (HAD superfamily)